MNEQPVFFAMVPDDDGMARPAFFLRQAHAPDGAHQITARRHEQLLAALSDGRAVAAKPDGSPKVERSRINADARRAELKSAIRKEAARRIAQVSPIWRQLNDQREPSEAGAVRFAQIDAIRAASELIEAGLADVAAADLSKFPIRANPSWPEID